VTADRVCTVCGDPVILAYMGLNEEAVDTLHAFGVHDHDADTDTSDVDDALYGQPPAGWAE
jgi:hypothetical protein